MIKIYRGLYESKGLFLCGSCSKYKGFRGNYYENSTYTWNSDGTLAAVNTPPFTHSYSYDAQKRLVTHVDSYYGKSTKYRYTDNGTVITQSEALNQSPNDYLDVIQWDLNQHTETRWFNCPMIKRDTDPGCHLKPTTSYRLVFQYAFMSWIPFDPAFPQIYNGPSLADGIMDKTLRSGVVRFGLIGKVKEFGPNGYEAELPGTSTCTMVDKHTLSCDYAGNEKFFYYRTYDIYVQVGPSSEKFTIVREHFDGRIALRMAVWNRTLQSRAGSGTTADSIYETKLNERYRPVVATNTQKSTALDGSTTTGAWQLSYTYDAEKVFPTHFGRKSSGVPNGFADAEFNYKYK